MVCFDTAFFADLFRKNPEAEKILEEMKDAREPISTTVITIAELYYGAYKSTRFVEEKSKVEQIIERFIVFELNIRASEKYGEIRSYLEKEGKPLADRDMLIGAIFLTNGEETIVTRNKEHFKRIPGIKIVAY